jgi:hypothetical protein
MTNYIVIAKFWSDGETHAGTLCGRRIFKARAPPSHLHSSYLEYVQGPVNVFLDTEIEAQVTRWTVALAPSVVPIPNVGAGLSGAHLGSVMPTLGTPLQYWSGPSASQSRSERQ